MVGRHRHVPAIQRTENRRDATLAVRDVGGLYDLVVTQRLFQQSASDTVVLHPKKAMNEVEAAWVAAGAKLASKTARVLWKISRCSRGCGELRLASWGNMARLSLLTRTV